MTRKTLTSGFRALSIRPGVTNRRTGFTLIELSVTIAIVLMIVAIVVPTMTKLLASRSQEEAFNLIAAQLTAARAEAVASNTYAGVHVQLGPKGSNREHVSYSLVIILDPSKLNNYVEGASTDSLTFTLAKPFIPQKLPGGTALGKLTSDYVDDRASPPDPNAPAGTPVDTQGHYKNLADGNLPNFTSLSVIFSPNGTVVEQVKGGNIKFDSNDPMFSGNTKLWDFAQANNQRGVMAFTMFNFPKVWKLVGTGTGSTDRTEYLNDNGQFLPVNMHTGQLFDRQ